MVAVGCVGSSIYTEAVGRSVWLSALAGTGEATAVSGVTGVVVRLVRLVATAGVVAATRGCFVWCVVAVAVSCSRWQSFIPLVSTHSPSSLFLRNRGDWRRIEPSGLGPEYRVVALVVTLAVPLSLFSQWLSFFVSTLEALPRDPASRLPPHPACSLVGVPGRHLALGG